MRRVDIHHTDLIVHAHFGDADTFRQPRRLVLAAREAFMNFAGAGAGVNGAQGLVAPRAARNDQVSAAGWQIVPPAMYCTMIAVALTRPPTKPPPGALWPRSRK